MKIARTPSRQRLNAGLTFTLVGAALACSPRAESVRDYEAKIAVRRYNELLPAAFAKGSVGALAGAATPDEMRRVSDIIAFLGQGGMVMDARQESFDPGPVEREAPTPTAPFIFWMA